MDRTSVAVLLWLGTAWSTPRDITYVRIQPLAAQEAPPLPLPGPRESRIEHLPLTIGSGGESVRRPRSDPAPPTPTQEEPRTPTAPELESTTEPATTPEEPVERLYERRVPGPRFYSKLSYFSKDIDGGVSANLVGDGGGGRRKFRSRCRCARIWNCPKLQVSVARCPDEYFLCCF